jgi:monofunctional biosynthetic peptidoglycan transglycosylase
MKHHFTHFFHSLTSYLHQLSWWVKKYTLLFLFTSVALVTFYGAFGPFGLTPLMLERSITSCFTEDGCHWRSQQIVPLSDISPRLIKAVVSLEDPHFYLHHGFDWKAIRRAYQLNQRRSQKIGASTISQQTAKNLFLLPWKTYTRKVLEAYFTVLIEIFWDKDVILTHYLNIIEWGKYIHGIEAASQKYFKKAAKNLNQRESLRLAAMLPNPRRFNPVRPGPLFMGRQVAAEKRMLRQIPR